MNTQELKIIYDILDSLANNSILENKYTYELTGDKDIKVNLNILNHSINADLEVRNEIRKEQLPRILSIADSANVILLAKKIYKDARDELVLNNVQYIEGNGNVYLHDENFYFLINTNKTNSNTKISAGRAFAKTGLKVIFNLLLNEGLLTMPYRQIADSTSVSLGNVTNIINSLKEQGFIKKLADERLMLNNKKQLYNKWVDNYEHVLKPAIEIGTFRFENESDRLDWRRLPLDSKRSVWGGEPAGHLMTGGIKPSLLTIYSNETRAELSRNYRMVRDDDGYIKVYGKFWEYNRYKNAHIAPSFLVYADLINSLNVNNHKAAAQIFDDVLKKQLEE